MISNVDVLLVRDIFSNIKSILCKRKINSKNPKATTKKVIIKDY